MYLGNPKYSFEWKTVELNSDWKNNQKYNHTYKFSRNKVKQSDEMLTIQLQANKRTQKQWFLGEYLISQETEGCDLIK